MQSVCTKRGPGFILSGLAKSDCERELFQQTPCRVAVPVRTDIHQRITIVSEDVTGGAGSETLADQRCCAAGPYAFNGGGGARSADSSRRNTENPRGCCLLVAL